MMFNSFVVPEVDLLEETQMFFPKRLQDWCGVGVEPDEEDRGAVVRPCVFASACAVDMYEVREARIQDRALWLSCVDFGCEGENFCARRGGQRVLQ